MNLAMLLANEFEVWDGIETVTFSVMDEGTVTTSQTVAGALRRKLGKRASQLSEVGLALEPEDLVWHLPVVNLAGLAPKPGDRITDAANAAYTVLSALQSTLGSRWACLARRQRS